VRKNAGTATSSRRHDVSPYSWLRGIMSTDTKPRRDEAEGNVASLFLTAAILIYSVVLFLSYLGQ
jgi:hypothetical protein